MRLAGRSPTSALRRILRKINAFYLILLVAESLSLQRCLLICDTRPFSPTNSLQQTEHHMPLDSIFGHHQFWNWPRKKYSLKLEINSSLTRSPVQKQPDCYTVTSNVIGLGYKSTLSTRRRLIRPLASSGSVCDQYTPWSGWQRRTPWLRYRNNWRFDSCSPGSPTQKASPDSGLT